MDQIKEDNGDIDNLDSLKNEFAKLNVMYDTLDKSFKEMTKRASDNRAKVIALEV